MYSQRLFFVLVIFTLLFCAMVFPCLTLRAVVAAERPYEMSNACRNVNPNPPLINFENITGWTVDTVESEAKFERSTKQRIWGEGIGKLTYKNVQSEQRKTPVITLKAPQPVAIPMPFDCIDLWLYGNNWAWESDNSTPRVRVDALLRAGDVNPPILIAEKNWAERSWTPLTADLSKWQGKTIRLKLVADVGTKDNSNADWAAWTDFKLVPTKKVLITTVE